MATILFLHGWNSKPGGLKPTYLAEHGHTVINPALPDESFAESVRIAQAEFDRHHPDVVVGSSRGGAVAMNFRPRLRGSSCSARRGRSGGRAKTVKPGTLILHSEADDVVPIAHSRELVTASGLARFGADHCWDRPPAGRSRAAGRAAGGGRADQLRADKGPFGVRELAPALRRR